MATSSSGSFYPPGPVAGSGGRRVGVGAEPAPCAPQVGRRDDGRNYVGRALSACVLAVTLLAGCGTLPQREAVPASTALAPAMESPLVRIVQNSQPSPELTGFRLMPLGVFSLDARIELADRARTSLDVQYYQIHHDKTGRLLLRHLRSAAQRGVRVRLLVDDLYTTGGDELFRGFAAFPNVEVRLFNPFCCGRDGLVSKFTWSLLDFRRVNRRMHNKLFIADGVIAIAGGRNIADEYFMRGASENFVDMDALMIGAVVPQLSNIFDAYWNAPEVYPVEAIVVADGDSATLRRRFDELVEAGEQMMKIVLPPVDALGYGGIREDLDHGRLGLVWGTAEAFADPPGKASEPSDDKARAMSVQLNVMGIVAGARKDVQISSPYLIPGDDGVATFASLGRRDVKVTILTNSLAATDEPLVHTGYVRYREAMLSAGVDLYELSPVRIKSNRRLGFSGASLGRLHAKTVVVDHDTVFIGSMNLDPRSASINTELGVIAQSPQLAKEVIRVLRLSKLLGAYRVRFGTDGRSLEWLTMDDHAEVILTEEPDSTFLMRLHHAIVGPFVPEQQL